MGETLNPTAPEFNPNNYIPIPVAVGIPYPYPPYAVTPPPHLSTTPTRSILLSPAPPTPETDLRKDLSAFGEVRAVQTDSFRNGVITVHYYDLRHAETAFAAIRTHHVTCAAYFNPLSYSHIFSTPPPPPPPGLVAGVPLWAHYVLSDAQNQGTLVVFNLDEDDFSSNQLKQVFEAYGAIKEVRDTKKRNQSFVEFFDIRDAEKALKELNGKEINGKPIAIEFSKPKLFHSNANAYISNKPFNYNINPPPSPRRRFAPRPHSPQLSNKSLTFNHNRIGSMGSLKGEERYPFVRVQSRESFGESAWGWKGKIAKKHENRFLIKEDAIVESDPRTTLMIKNIPNKYSQKLLLNMLDNHCVHCNEQLGDGEPLSSYDFVYLPIDFKNKCNVGYGFVNMTSPEATLRFYKAFQHQHWEVFNSRKICQLTYARVQGLEALKEHFKNSKFPCEMEHYLPVVFSPPRDGKQLTEPIPVAGNMLQIGAAPSVADEIEGQDHRVGSGGCDVISRKSGGIVGDDDDKTDVK